MANQDAAFGLRPLKSVGQARRLHRNELHIRYDAGDTSAIYIKVHQLLASTAGYVDLSIDATGTTGSCT